MRPSVEANRATSDEVSSIEATLAWITGEGAVISNPTERRLFFCAFEHNDDGELRVSDYSYQ